MSDLIRTELFVTGMTCGHCVRSVTQELGAVAGVEDVTINLNPQRVSRVQIASVTPIDPARLRDAVAEAGYALAASES